MVGPTIPQVFSGMSALQKIDVSKIQIPDVRVSSVLNEEQRALISSTIKEVGVVQDIVVRDLGAGEYELVAGKSRLEELVKLGITETQVKVIGADEKLALIMNIAENVARGSYEYISVARAIRKLRELGTPQEQLEKIFPWRRRWIRFIEDLQDLPGDVQEGIRTKKLTPTHVQLALNLPTPQEVHQGLQTAMIHSWDTQIFKTFVENRVEQVAAAKQRAAELGQDPEIPPARPQELIRYRQCLVCGYQKPVEKITTLMVCEDCVTLNKYITSQIGAPEEAIKVVYAALRAYYGPPRPQIPPGPGPISEPSPQ